MWQIDPIQPMADDFGRFSCSPMARSNECNPPPYDEAKLAPAPLTNGSVYPKLPAWDPSAGPFDEQRGPVSIFMPTRPVASPNMRSAAHGRRPRTSSERGEIDMPPRFVAKKPVAKPTAVASSRAEVVVAVPRNNGTVPPKLPPRDPPTRPSVEKRGPVSTVRSTPPATSQQSNHTAHVPRPSPPRMLGDTDIPTVGGAKAPVAKLAAVASSSLNVPAVESAAPVTCGLVLPCPPSDAEKVRHV